MILENRQHWLMIEADLTGHREVYLTNLAQGAIAAGHDLTIAVSDSKLNDDPLERLSSSISSAKLVRFALPNSCSSFGGALNDLKREFAFRAFFKKIYEEINSLKPVDEVFLPFFDYALNAISLMGSPFGQAKVSGIVMRPMFHFKAMGVRAPYKFADKIKRSLFLLFLLRKNINKVFSIDETLVEYSGRQRMKSWTKIKMIHDPATLSGNSTRKAARAEFNLKNDARVILVYGSIDLRKGISQLLAGMSDNSVAENCVVIVAGRFSDEVKALMSFPANKNLIESGRVFTVDRRISDEEEYSLLLAADAVWVGYIGHYTMSGVIVKAMMAGRFILACGDGLIGWHAGRIGGAVVFDPCNKQEVIHALTEIPAETGFIQNGAMQNYSWSAALSKIFGLKYNVEQ